MRMNRMLVAVAVPVVVAVSALDAAAKVDFAKQIKPIIERSCLSCHSAVKTKGKLRLDTKELAFKGTPDDKVILPGMPDKSPMYVRVSLPADDPDIMPAKGDTLSKAEQALFKAWIQEGADWPDGLALKAAGAATAAPTEDVAGKPITDAEKAAVDKVQQAGANAMRLAQNSNWLRVDFSLHAKGVSDADLAPLKSMTNLYELDLGGTSVNDASLAQLAGLTNLHRLHLEKTKVTGSGLASLKGMNDLHYLNLYGTEVDDKSLDLLKDLKGLKKLYLWQTKVTDEGVKKLQQAMPDLYINTGFEAPAAAAKPAEEKKDEKKAEKK